MMYLSIILLALFVYYAIPVVVLVFLFQNEDFSRWYRHNPWQKMLLMALVTTAIRLVIICSTWLAGKFLTYFTFLFLLDTMIAGLFPGANWYLGQNPIPPMLLLATPVNLVFWLIVFSTITSNTKPTRPKPQSSR